MWLCSRPIPARSTSGFSRAILCPALSHVRSMHLFQLQRTACTLRARFYRFTRPILRYPRFRHRLFFFFLTSYSEFLYFRLALVLATEAEVFSLSNQDIVSSWSNVRLKDVFALVAPRRRWSAPRLRRGLASLGPQP